MFCSVLCTLLQMIPAVMALQKSINDDMKSFSSPFRRMFMQRRFLNINESKTVTIIVRRHLGPENKTCHPEVTSRAQHGSVLLY